MRVYIVFYGKSLIDRRPYYHNWCTFQRLNCDHRIDLGRHSAGFQSFFILEMSTTSVLSKPPLGEGLGPDEVGQSHALGLGFGMSVVWSSRGKGGQLSYSINLLISGMRTYSLYFVKSYVDDIETLSPLLNGIGFSQGV
jgi:hypothetical protein